MPGSPGFECTWQSNVIFHKAPSQPLGQGCWCSSSRYYEQSVGLHVTAIAEWSSDTLKTFLSVKTWFLLLPGKKKIRCLELDL